MTIETNYERTLAKEVLAMKAAGCPMPAAATLLAEAIMETPVSESTAPYTGPERRMEDHGPQGGRELRKSIWLPSETNGNEPYRADMANGDGAASSESMATSEGYPGIAHDLETMRTALQEIAKGEGEFSRDPLAHAGNTIDAMKKLATDALRGVK